MTFSGINVFKHSFKRCLFCVLQLLLAISQNLPKGSVLQELICKFPPGTREPWPDVS